MKVVAVVPLRIGSTRVKQKNIRHLLGKPLASYMMRALNESLLVDQVYLSTSSDEIEQALTGFCDFVRVHRPDDMSVSTACVPEIFTHAGDKIGLNDDDIFITVDATYPFIKPEWIDDCIRELQETEGATCSFVSKDAERPEFACARNEKGYFEPFYKPPVIQKGLDWAEYVHTMYEPKELVYGPCGIAAYYYGELKRLRNPWMKVPSTAITVPKVYCEGVDTPDDWEMVEVIARYLEMRSELN